MASERLFPTGTARRTRWSRGREQPVPAADEVLRPGDEADGEADGTFDEFVRAKDGETDRNVELVGSLGTDQGRRLRQGEHRPRRSPL
ncbi:hypothetical protein ABTZ93_12400 [Streptomyces sp. NPDC097941]|uniref:hypothetical protein n=1 Tax=Streptomyces sp. NPDC097941 TaxID=3155685 RepID=UPI003322C145